MAQFSRLFVLSFLISTLSACATPSEMRQQAPELELKSNLAAKSVSICIADRWENNGTFGAPVIVNMRPIEGGYTVEWINGFDHRVFLLVDVKDTLDGSLTRCYKGVVLGGASFTQIVIDCQDPKKSK
jgi:hypothetical protein